MIVPGLLRAALGLALLAAVAGLARAENPAPLPVFFDEAHGERFRTSETGPTGLSTLAAHFAARGGAVRASTHLLTSETLERAVVMFLSGPTLPLATAEIETVAGWVERGGALVVTLHVEPPVGALLHRFGISVSNGVIREGEKVPAGQPLDFRVTRLRPHALTRGLRGFSVHRALALLPTTWEFEAVAETSPEAWVDLNGNGRFDKGDARQAFAVVVAGARGRGRVVVFGDDTVFQNQTLRGENRLLVQNLATWLFGR